METQNYEGIASGVEKLLARIESLLRYTAPGFVTLGTIALVGPTTAHEYLVDQPKNLTTTLVLGCLLGMVMYTAHLPLLTLLLNPFHVWFLRRKSKSANPAEPGREDSFLVRQKSSRQIVLELTRARYLRRASANEHLNRLQRELTRWNSNVHFLYCASYAFVLAPVGATLVDQHPSWFRFTFLLAGLLCFCGAFFSDLQNFRLQLLIFVDGGTAGAVEAPAEGHAPAIEPSNDR